MKLRVLFVVLICFTGCKKEKPEYNETYSKFYGKWRSVNLEHPIEFDFGPKTVNYKGYMDRNARIHIHEIFEYSYPQFRSIALYVNYGNGKPISINYNITMDTITCDLNFDFSLSGNAEYKEVKMIRK